MYFLCRLRMATLICLLLLPGLTACETDDPLEDLDKYYQFVISGTLTKSARSDAGAEAHLNPLIDKDGKLVENLRADQVTLSEDGAARTVTVNLVSDQFPSAADFVFLIDKTGSMSNSIAGVKDSVIDYADYLTECGFDVQLGGIAFEDQDDQQKRFDLSADPEEFKDWVETLEASGGTMGAENALNAAMDAFTDFTWRRNAQRIFILITDASMHQPDDWDDFEHDNTENDLDTVCAALESQAAVHVVSSALDSLLEGNTNPRYLAACTGGLWLELPTDGYVDLGDEIVVAMSTSWVIAFPSSDPSGTHTVELTIKLDGDTSGSNTWTDVTYAEAVKRLTVFRR